MSEPSNLHLELAPEILAWVEQNGGTAWITEVLNRLHAKGFCCTKTRVEFQHEAERAIVGGIKDAMKSHGGELLAGSAAKRASAQLWADWCAVPEPPEALPDDPLQLMQLLEERGVVFSHHQAQFLNHDGP